MYHVDVCAIAMMTMPAGKLRKKGGKDDRISASDFGELSARQHVPSKLCPTTGRWPDELGRTYRYEAMQRCPQWPSPAKHASLDSSLGRFGCPTLLNNLLDLALVLAPVLLQTVKRQKGRSVQTVGAGGTFHICGEGWPRIGR
jgi:hypothetical protein